VWLVDLVRRELVSTVATPWADDLPLVSGGRSLVMRDGDDVEAWDLTGSVPEPRTRLHDAAGDVFLAIPWRPRESRPRPSPTPTEQVATGVDPAQADSAAAPGDAETDPVQGEIFIQVTASQNKRYADALADQLEGIGFRTRVTEPKPEGDGYRVLVGPYSNREAAEADGKRLGQPYFIRTTPGDQP
jgi:hypothetical protein